MTPRFACDGCGQLEEPRWLSGGLCPDCRYADPPAATTSVAGPCPDVRQCVACGADCVHSELCARCNRDIAREFDEAAR